MRTAHFLLPSRFASLGPALAALLLAVVLGCGGRGVKMASATSLAVASSGAAVANQTITFTATVKSAAVNWNTVPTGTITFSDGATALAQVALDGTGAAAWATSTLAVGSHTINAAYSGDACYLGSTAALSQTVFGFTTQPQALTATIAAGGTDTAVSFTADAPGAASYQWQVSTDGVNFTDIPGATGPSYGFNATTGSNGNWYRVVATDAGGDTATSNQVQLTLQWAPIFTTQPVGLVTAIPTPVTLTAVTSARPAATTYQWFRNGVAIPGATSPSYLVDPGAAGGPTEAVGSYQVAATNAVGTTQSDQVDVAYGNTIVGTIRPFQTGGNVGNIPVDLLLSGVVQATTQTDANGNYAFFVGPVATPTTYTLSARAPSSLARSLVTPQSVTVPIQPGPASLNIAPDMFLEGFHSVSGTVDANPTNLTPAASGPIEVSLTPSALAANGASLAPQTFGTGIQNPGTAGPASSSFTIQGVPDALATEVPSASMAPTGTTLAPSAALEATGQGDATALDLTGSGPSFALPDTDETLSPFSLREVVTTPASGPFSFDIVGSYNANGIRGLVLRYDPDGTGGQDVASTYQIYLTDVTNTSSPVALPTLTAAANPYHLVFLTNPAFTPGHIYRAALGANGATPTSATLPTRTAQPFPADQTASLQQGATLALPATLPAPLDTSAPTQLFAGVIGLNPVSTPPTFYVAPQPPAVLSNGMALSFPPSIPATVNNPNYLPFVLAGTASGPVLSVDGLITLPATGIPARGAASGLISSGSNGLPTAPLTIPLQSVITTSVHQTFAGLDFVGGNGAPLQDAYFVDVTISNPATAIAAVTLTGAPSYQGNPVTPVPASLYLPEAALQVQVSINDFLTPPQAGDTYTLQVTYANGSTQAVTATLGVAAPNAPILQTNPGSGTTPDFAWQAPLGPPANYTYGLTVLPYPVDYSSRPILQQFSIPSGTTALNWTDLTGNSGFALTPGTPYTIHLVLRDAAGNQGVQTSTYTP